MEKMSLEEVKEKMKGKRMPSRPKPVEMSEEAKKSDRIYISQQKSKRVLGILPYE